MTKKIGWMLSAAIGATMALATGAFAHGMSAGGGVPVAVHSSRSFSANPFRFGFRPFVFRPAFPQERFGSARFLGWSGGAYSGDVAATEDEGTDPDNIYFRVQEPFGPGDLGRPEPAEGPGDMGTWEGPRPPPSYANGPYGSQGR